MRKPRQIFLLIALAFTAGAASLSSLYHAQTPQDIAAVSNPAEGASYYATNQNDLYYSGIDDTLTGEDLIVALSTLTSTGFVSKSYSSLPDIYRYSDVSLTNSGKMVMVYTGTEVSFSPGSMPSNSNKEHVWPASWYGNGRRTESAGSPGADAHNVWPSASELNSKRGSCAFDELDFSSSYKSYEFTRSDWSYGTPGDNDSYVWSTAFDYSSGQPTDALYPSRGHRGAIARILMYVATRYRNNTTYPVMLHDQAVTLSSGRIGKLSTLLKWHYLEPPSEWEIKRNNEVASRWHHNRNPFVDHPEYATKIYYHLPEPGQSAPTPSVKSVIETYGDLHEGIVLDHSSLSLNIGQSTKINVASNPNSETITWSSDNLNVATVDNQGNISAISAGTATITAQGTESSATCEVNVIDPDAVVLISNLSISPASATLRVGEEVTLNPTISPTSATNKILDWTSSNSGVAVVNSNGHVIAVSQGNVTITAAATDGSGKTATCNVTVTPSISEEGGWNLVSDASSLQAGDRLVIASNESGKTAGDISSSIMTSLSSTFDTNNEKIVTLHENTIQFTLGGVAGAWTFSNDSDQLLGVTGVKKLAWDSGTTTWKISISTSNATIESTNSSFGRFLYNDSAPRFTTYTSDVSSSMLLPQLYRFVDDVNPAKEGAYDYISTFMNTTASECAALDVKSSTWSTLKSGYEILLDESKNYIYEHSENDVLIAAMVERYAVIINKYGYDNFLTDALGNPVLMALNSDDGIDLLGSEAAIAVAIISFAGIIFISLAGFLFYQKTKKTDTLI